MSERSVRVPLLVAATLVFIAWVFSWWGNPIRDTWGTRTAGSPYQLQTQAWLHGHTYLDVVPDPQLATLSNPYNGEQNRPYRVLDLSYFRGRYYSYFGPGPILMLILPLKGITGLYATDRFCVIVLGFGAVAMGSLLILLAWRRYFPAVPGAAAFLSVLVLAFGNLLVRILDEPNFYEVAQMGAYFAEMCALAAAFAALEAPPRRAWLWVGASSLACGLAIASRPNFLLASALVLPVAWTLWRRGGPLRGSGMARPLVAAAGPIGVIVVGLLFYNAVRFGSPLEFGNRFQLSEVDLSTAKLLSPAFAAEKLNLLTGPVHRVHYFPFVTTSMEPVGIVTGLPFLLLSLGGAFALLMGAGTPGRRSAPFLLSAALGPAGVLVLLLFYKFNWVRYEVDLLFPLSFSAALGWLCIVAWCRASSAAKGAVAMGTVLAAFSLWNSLTFSARDFPYPAKLVALGELFNRPVYAWDSLRGVRFGRMKMRVRFPAGGAPASLPLLSSGFLGGDVVTAHMIDAGHVSLGYFHAGIGGPLSDPLSVDLARPHDLEIFEGSFLPPAGHPMFSGWAAADIDRAKHRLVVRLDGKDALAQDADFYESDHEHTHVGLNPGLGPDVSAAAFTGTLEQVSQLPYGPGDSGSMLSAPAPIASLSIRFPANRESGTEPLISTGAGDSGVLLSVSYLPGSRVRFNLVQAAAERMVTKPMRIDAGAVHALVVQLGSLGPSAARGGKPDPEIAVALDGRLLARAQWPTQASDPQRTEFGVNTAIYDPNCSEMFSGTILSVAAGDPKAFGLGNAAASAGRWGPVVLKVYFPEIAGSTNEPLVTTGSPGAGDFIYYFSAGAGRVRFGFDHWGVGGFVGSPVEIDAGAAHVLEMRMDSLYPPGSRDSGQSNRVSVVLDGKTVLSGSSPCHPTAPDAIRIGENRIGGSTCGPAFTGEILGVSRSDGPNGPRVWDSKGD